MYTALHDKVHTTTAAAPSARAVPTTPQAVQADAGGEVADALSARILRGLATGDPDRAAYLEDVRREWDGFGKLGPATRRAGASARAMRAMNVKYHAALTADVIEAVGGDFLFTNDGPREVKIPREGRDWLEFKAREAGCYGGKRVGRVFVRVDDPTGASVVVGRHGLVYSDLWLHEDGVFDDEDRKPVYIFPSPADALAAETMDATGIGMTDPDGDLWELKQLLMDCPPERNIYVVGPREWAVRVARYLAANIAFITPRGLTHDPFFAWATPPGGHATVRSWLDAQLQAATEAPHLPDLAREFHLTLWPQAPEDDADRDEFGRVREARVREPQEEPIPSAADEDRRRPVIDAGSPVAAALHPVPGWYDYLPEAARRRCEPPESSEIELAELARAAAREGREKEAARLKRAGAELSASLDGERRRRLEAQWAARALTAADVGRVAAVTPATPKAAEPKATAAPVPEPELEYRAEAGRTYHLRWENLAGAFVPDLLAHFEAKVVAEVVRDDGAETSTVFELAGKLANGRPLPTVHVRAEDYADMKWPTALWGVQAVVEAGRTCREHMRAAIQLLSGDVPRHIEYTHTGWRNTDGVWRYLHGGGAIGPDGPVAGVSVHLPDALRNYVLPVPPAGAELIAAIRASLALLDGLAPDRVVLPLYAAVWRAVLGGSDGNLHLNGRTGTFKSELAALCQQHFGAGLDARHLPANWESTANALERLAFSAKDALLVVDDFIPHGSASDMARMHRDADRLLRASGNGSGRQRMRADLTLHADKPPRCLIVSTGEDTPRGQSLQARLLTDEVKEGDVDVARLTPRQADAAAGRYAEAMAGFVRWLAGRLDGVRARLPAATAAARDAAYRTGQHRRTPGIVANLKVGLDCFLEFAHQAGALEAADARKIQERFDRAMEETASRQAVQQRDGDPARQFVGLVTAALASGRAHVAGVDGKAPTLGAIDAEGVPQAIAGRWGWRPDPDEKGRWYPQGACVGWLDGADLYLEPEASYAEAQRMAADQRDTFATTKATLCRRLADAKLLASTSGERGLKARKVILGQRRDVLHFLAARFLDLDGLDPKPRVPDLFGLDGDAVE